MATFWGGGPTRGEERRLKRLQEKEARLSMVVAFEAYGRPLEMVTSFD